MTPSCHCHIRHRRDNQSNFLCLINNCVLFAWNDTQFSYNVCVPKYCNRKDNHIWEFIVSTQKFDAFGHKNSSSINVKKRCAKDSGTNRGWIPWRMGQHFCPVSAVGELAGWIFFCRPLATLEKFCIMRIWNLAPKILTLLLSVLESLVSTPWATL